MVELVRHSREEMGSKRICFAYISGAIPCVCPESHRLLTGGSPVVVIVRKPRSRQPVQRVIVCAEAL